MHSESSAETRDISDRDQWDITSPERDGALENDIVVHENTHGTWVLVADIPRSPD
jgi:hypothetical protein